jgi:hypothetical protein
MTKGMSAREKADYMKKFPDITVAENLLSRLIEMRSFRNPPEELIQKLHNKGLLQNPLRN